MGISRSARNDTGVPETELFLDGVNPLIGQKNWFLRSGQGFADIFKVAKGGIPLISLLDRTPDT